MVSVNTEECIGCGLCASIAPETFEMKNGKAHVKSQSGDKDKAKEAIENCPVSAIKE